jgi:hypothetical protein
MNLATFVSLKMKEKNLSAIDIERNSDHQITDGYVGTVLAGNATNPTLKILLALAKGLDVHPVEVFKAAAEVDDPEETWSADMLAMAIQRMLRLKPAKVKSLKKLLEIE